MRILTCQTITKWCAIHCLQGHLQADSRQLLTGAACAGGHDAAQGAAYIRWILHVEHVYIARRGTFKPIPDSYSPELHSLVGAMLQKEPRHRPTAAAILAMPYVRQHVQVQKMCHFTGWLSSPDHQEPDELGAALQLCCCHMHSNFSSSVLTGAYTNAAGIQRACQAARAAAAQPDPISFLAKPTKLFGVYPIALPQVYSAHARRHAQRRRASIRRCLAGYLDDAEVPTFPPWPLSCPWKQCCDSMMLTTRFTHGMHAVCNCSVLNLSRPCAHLLLTCVVAVAGAGGRVERRHGGRTSGSG